MFEILLNQSVWVYRADRTGCDEQLSCKTGKGG